MSAKGYEKWSEFTIKHHDGEESFVTATVYDLTEEKYDELYELLDEKGSGAVSEAVKDDLEALDDWFVMPGALFHRFHAELIYPHTVILYDTIAYNV